MKISSKPVPVVMTIAGSDSGGGAGIQADLKTFAALGVFGTSAISCVTAQNPSTVSRVYSIDAGMVAEQIMTVCAGFTLSGAKTGMLYSEHIIRAVAQCAAKYRIPKLVVDPVMVSTSRAQLLRPDAVNTLCWELMPKAAVVTPNILEAEVLCGKPISSLEGAKEAAHEIAERFKTACVVKGGHLGADEKAKGGKKKGKASRSEVVDVLYAGGKITEFRCPRVDAAETHGTGCTFSAALAAFLAMDMPLPKAVQASQKYVYQALCSAVNVVRHHPLGWPLPKLPR